MKRFYKIHEGYSNYEENLPEEHMQNFDKYRIRFNSPFKLRAPTPPRSREISPKNPHLKTQYFRHSSVDSADVFVLKVPFSSVNFVNPPRTFQNSLPQKTKKYPKGRKNCNYKRHRRSGSVDGYINN